MCGLFDAYEIAKLLDMPEGTVRRQYREAIEHLGQIWKTIK